MKKMTIKEYAIAHKLSIYNVVKMTKNGTLQTETKKVDGKDEVFILQGEENNTQTAISELLSKEDKVEDYEKAYFALQAQYKKLHKKYEELQKKVGN